MIITIDGPTASGKSSVAQALAQRLSFYYLNTGLLYRAVAYIILENIHSKSSDDLVMWLSQDKELQRRTLRDAGLLRASASNIFDFIDELEYKYIDNQAHVFLKNHDITEYLSDAVIGQCASMISGNKEIREKLLLLQRSIGQKNNIIVDGRDCGSVVFPDAQYKFFLTASLDTRAGRALLDPMRNQQEKNLEQIKQMLSERDKRDRERDIAPLIVPDGAIMIDNSGINLEQTVDLFLTHIINV